MNGVQILLVMAGALTIAAIAHRRGFQAGVVTVILGAVVSFVPGLPRLELDPELILGAVVPPLLYSAALNFSLYTFFQNLRGILGLGVGLVVFTTAVVGYITSWIAPDLGLAGAFVLAAVVSPPDTITTISHGKELGMPRRIVSVLTGESLVNDAAALTLFAIAVAAVTGEAGFISNPFLLFGWEALIGLIIGLALGFTASAVRATIGDPTIESGLNLLVPFIAYLAAEQVEASGIIAVVAAGFTVSIRTNGTTRGTATSATTYRTRLQEAALWPVVNLGLETFVFAYIGLQLRFVLEDLAASDIAVASTIRLGLVVLLAVMLCRFAWVYASYGRRRSGERPPARRLQPPRGSAKAAKSWASDSC